MLPQTYRIDDVSGREHQGQRRENRNYSVCRGQQLGHVHTLERTPVTPQPAQPVTQLLEADDGQVTPVERHQGKQVEEADEEVHAGDQQQEVADPGVPADPATATGPPAPPLSRSPLTRLMPMTPTAPFGSRWLLKIVEMRCGKCASELTVPVTNVPSVVIVLRAAVAVPRWTCWAVMPRTGTFWVPPLSFGWVCSFGRDGGGAHRAVALVLHDQRRPALVGPDGPAQLVEGRHGRAADADQAVTGLQPGGLGGAALVRGACSSGSHRLTGRWPAR